MFDHYVALHTPEQSGLLAWSALPHAPVLSDQRPRRPAGRLRRGTAWALVGLAERLKPAGRPTRARPGASPTGPGLLNDPRTP